jgi:hypothetical protein
MTAEPIAPAHAGAHARAAATGLQAPSQQTIQVGGVVQLAGTPHLWIAGDGALHWAGDTRALAGHRVNWGDRRELTLADLLEYPIGDPWLYGGLIKMGDPIYFVKWETDQAAPTLLHIQSILDVELFGIDASNYGKFVLERADWERRFELSVDTLPRERLAPAAASAILTSPPAAQPTAAPRPANRPPAAAPPAPRISFAQAIVGFWWQPGQLPALYVFRTNGTGVRTTYPTGNLTFGQSFHFAWYLNGSQLRLQFPSGHTDIFTLQGYNAQTDVFRQTGSRQSPEALYGCRSGQMPQVIRASVCR